MTRPSFDELRRHTHNHWPQLLATLGIDPAYLVNRHGPCPGCAGHDRFRFDDRDGNGSFYCNQHGAGDGFALLAHVHGWTPARVLEEVAQAVYLPGVSKETRPFTPHDKDDPERLARNRSTALALWEQAVMISHHDAEPARLYLLHRHLEALCPEDLPEWRYHPALAFWVQSDGEPVKLGEYPALLAALRYANGQPAALHATYLTTEGRKLVLHHAGKPQPSRKVIKRFAPVSGASIHLYPATSQRLAIAEGIESALSARVADPALPVWAAYSAGNLETVQLPGELRQLLILTDRDSHGRGEQAARALAARASREGVDVRLVLPRHGDLNDALQGVAHAG